MDNVAERLVKARGDKPRSVVSHDLEIKYSTMCAYESGFRRPSDKVKQKIADYYGTTVQDLFY